MKNLKKFFTKKGVDEVEVKEDGVLQLGVATTDDIDRDGEVLTSDGWDLENFKSNPVLLWSHNPYDLPVGKVMEIWDDNGKKYFSAKFNMEDDFAVRVYKAYKGGFLNTFSVGFQVKEREGNRITRKELLEISAVSIPANPKAEVVMRGLSDCGFSKKEIKDYFGLETKEKEEEEKDEKSLEDVKKELAEAQEELRRKESVIGNLRNEKKALQDKLNEKNEKIKEEKKIELIAIKTAEVIKTKLNLLLDGSADR